MNRKPLISLHKAQELYGVDKTTFVRPRYVPEGACEWCASPLPNKRRKAFCNNECRIKFMEATSSVMYNNTGSAGGYRNHIMRRDNYTCQKCGEAHYCINENGIPIPTTDGLLDIHHIIRVADGGTDAPDNLITLCRECHKRAHKEVNNGEINNKSPKWVNTFKGQ